MDGPAVRVVGRGCRVEEGDGSAEGEIDGFRCSAFGVDQAGLGRVSGTRVGGYIFFYWKKRVLIRMIWDNNLEMANEMISYFAKELSDQDLAYLVQINRIHLRY